MSYFPMFVELKNQDCLVVGGGSVALRKVNVLRDFGAEILVVAPAVMPEIKAVQNVKYREKEFEDSDLAGKVLVVAATDDKALNHRIAELCHMHKIPVNAVDQQEDCSFIFPSYVRQGEVVAAFSSGGQSPLITQYLKGKAKSCVTEHIGELAACLGSIRELVKHDVKGEENRRQVYVELLQLGLERDIIPTEEQIQLVIQKYKKEE